MKGSLDIKERIVGLDILRILFALFIYFFHSIVHIGCNYIFLQNFMNASVNMAMTGFFMLSGCSLYVAYGSIDILSSDNLFLFYKKRAIAIYPLYIITGTLYVLMVVAAGKQNIIDNLLLLPVELIGIQSFFELSLFEYSHNSGTWFVSCLLVCYVLYPLLQVVISRMTSKRLILAMILVVFLLSYLPIINGKYGSGSIYTNPWFRLMEFTIGILLANIKMANWYIVYRKFFHSVSVALIVFLIMLIGESFFYSNHISRDFITLVFLIYFLLCAKNLKLTKESPILTYLNSLAFAFFLGQLFVWNPMKYLLLYYDFPNIWKIVISFAACLASAIILHHLVEVKIGGCLKKKYLQKTI